MSLDQRQQLIALIDQARTDGARLNQSCKTVEIDPATYRRWQSNGQVLADRRATAQRPEPANKLSSQEREHVLVTCHLPQYQSLPPSQIVPSLADQGVYIASESTVYRILHEAEEQHDRGRAKPRQKRAKPDAIETTGPNQCWTWGVTWLKSPVWYSSLPSGAFSPPRQNRAVRGPNTLDAFHIDKPVDSQHISL